VQKPGQMPAKLVVFALLDSPSVAGAYRFNIQLRARDRDRGPRRMSRRTEVKVIGWRR